MKYFTRSLMTMALLALSTLASACRCALPEGAIAALKRADVVVSAEAIAAKATTSKDSIEEQVVQWRVISSFKGKLKRKQIFSSKTMVSCCACGLRVKKGERYLLYISGEAPFALISCNGSKSLQDDAGKAELEVLKRYRKRQNR